MESECRLFNVRGRYICFRILSVSYINQETRNVKRSYSGKSYFIREPERERRNAIHLYAHIFGDCIVDSNLRNMQLLVAQRQSHINPVCVSECSNPPHPHSPLALDIRISVGRRWARHSQYREAKAPSTGCSGKLARASIRILYQGQL